MTEVVIDDIIPRTQLVAAAGQTVFNTNWTADATTDVLVYARAQGVPADDATQLVSSSLYNVTFVGGSQTVRVTFLSGRALNDIITIARNTPAERLNLYTNTNFVPSMLNNDFGILTLVDQQAQMYDTVIAPHYNVSAIIDNQDKILPILGPREVWRMNATGTEIEAYTIDNVPAPSDSYFITYGSDPTLENEQNLALLGNGLLKQSVFEGFATLALAIPGVDYLNPGVLGTMAFQNADNVFITGGFAGLTSGTVANAPVNSIDLVNKGYADAIAGGFTFKAAAYATTTTDLDATYNNGVSGVGATLTANNNGVLTMDGVNPPLNSRILVKDQTSPAENGIYLVTDAGSVSTPFILTRTTDFDSNATIVPGSIVFIQEGTLYAESSFVETEPVVTVGTDPILFIQFSQQYPLSMGNGGTGSAITPVPNGVFCTDGSSIAYLSDILPSGLTIPGYAHSGANSDITSLTGLTGVIQAPTFIQSSSALPILGFNYQALAVNYMSVGNAPTTTAPEFAVAGTDASISMGFRAKGPAGFFGFNAQSTTQPIQWYTGTSSQHTTIWNPPNTSSTRTYQLPDSDGTMALTSDLNWTLITTATASGSSTVQSFTNLTGYRQICIVYSNLTPATNTAQIGMLASINNGSSYLSAAGSYFWQVVSAVGATLTGQNSTSATFMQLSSNISNLGGAGMFGMIWVNNVSNTTTRKGWLSKCCHFNSGTSTPMSFDSAGEIITTSAINALQFATTAGNIATGEFAVYGIK